MNVISRGFKNALRSPLRIIAIVIMLAISIGLIVSMLIARSGIEYKITSVESQNATTITINAAGVRGGFGGGNPLTAADVAKITSTPHITSTVSTLSDQLTSSTTSLTPSQQLGKLGARFQRLDQGSNMPFAGNANFTPQPRITVTGTTNPNSASTSGGPLTISSGTTISGNSNALQALVGTKLATKNNLKPGSTFTAYSQTITVAGIYSTGNSFEDNGLIMPLATVQNLSGQAGEVASAAATADSSTNVSDVVKRLKSELGSVADITSQAQLAANTVNSLQGVSALATAGVVGATFAAAVIILLAMTIIVRERRREIGIIKAIGGTNIKIVGEFITEALTMTIIGAVIGFAFGIIVAGPITQSLVTNNQNQPSTPSRQVGSRRSSRFEAFAGRGITGVKNSVSDITATASVPTLIGAGIITLLIAVVGSAVPAWFIARIRPAEVLRTE
ncbi:MAG TPA: FtsX-like permease family protein [Candidatus Saccharimonadaceae bacterium]|nr:FtsX-like permease family protein [Candidatus Saccharimonadaceae bacterium]